jgi:hypothetical protein
MRWEGIGVGKVWKVERGRDWRLAVLPYSVSCKVRNFSVKISLWRVSYG